MTRKVDAGGPVLLSLRLSAPAKEALKRRDRLPISASVVFTPTGGGTAASSTIHAVLTPAVKSLPRLCSSP